MALPEPRLPEGTTRIVVGLSGGVDSSVLCHWLANYFKSASPKIPIIALHINHGLSAHAGSWQMAVMDFCRALGIECLCEQVTVDNCGQGIEAAARDARYSAFKRHLKPGDALALGHHLQDQAETVIFRLMRGAGVDGLAAMAEFSEREGLKLWRPLLNTSKDEILNYARTHHLRWVEDDSNSSDDFSRNFIRNNVLPLLQSQWPKAAAQLAQMAKIAAETKELNRLLVDDHWPSLEPRPERWGHSIAIAALMAKAPPLRAALLRYWLGDKGVTPEQVHLQEIEHLINARADRSPVFELGAISLRRFNGRLYLLTLPLIPEPCEFVGRTQLSDGSEVIVTGCNEPLSVRFRTEGLRAKPRGRTHSQTLKKLLQEKSIAPWLRSRLPLIYLGEQLLAVADLWVEASAGERLPSLCVEWRTPEA